MSNLQKLYQAKSEYDQLESIRLKASNLFHNEKYDVCVHFHYDNKIVISCGIKSNNPNSWASFDLIDGEISVTNRGNHNDADIENMLVFIENWIDD